MQRSEVKYYLKQFSRPVSMFALLVGFFGIILLATGLVMVVRYSRMLASLQEIKELAPGTATSSATLPQDSQLSLTEPTATSLPTEPPQPPTPPRPAQPPKTSPALLENPETSALPAKYTVTRGDSAWQLAERYYGKGELYPAILKANNLPRQAWLRPGMTLTIPTLDMSAKDHYISDVKITTKGGEPAKPSVGKPADQPIAESEQTYTVQKGDTLWFIAAKYIGPGASWTKLYERNKSVIGRNPHLIYPGMKLQLPASK